MSSDLEKVGSERLESGSRSEADRESKRESLEAPGRHSLSRVRSSSIVRIRSNNGHGVADLEEDNATDGTLALNQPQPEKDPFEVAWDGDDDPLALGPLIMSPLSEFIGRRPIYLVSWALFLIWLIPSAVAQNTATMFIARFIDGFAGSSFLSVAGGTVSDVFKRNEIQAPMAIISLSPFIDPIKLRDKARILRKETGDDRWKAPMEKSTKSVAATIGYSLLRPFQLLLFEPMCLLLCIFSALLLGILYLFFGAFPLVFGGNYGFNLWQTGLSFLGIFIGMIICSSTSPVWRRVHTRLVEQNGDTPEPEFRLPSAILGALLCPIGLFIFAWGAFPWVHWIVPIIGSGIFGCGTLLVFTGIFTFLVDAYPHFAASALAANSFTRCVFAAAFPLFGIQMYHKLGYQWGSSLLAFLTVVMIPFPYLFFRYGKQIRKNSRYAK
ncbi:hypothetical protein AAE478_006002 [Parahypoxylon ruwenzoriense]